MKLEVGDVYLAKRDDIVDIKYKFQLYLDTDCIFLINTEKSKGSISVLVRKEECKLLEYDSWICIDTLFRYDKKFKIITKEQVNPDVLKRLQSLISMSNGLDKIKQRKVIEVIKEYFDNQ
ncbi:MAG: hypothetical protein PHC64_07625 [Candidatus Gastranaerophilales bacterium]|nr:hypothetical protein [Candidatus Gastranaerophilales bacterium]